MESAIAHRVITHIGGNELNPNSVLQIQKAPRSRIPARILVQAGENAFRSPSAAKKRRRLAGLPVTGLKQVWLAHLL